MKAQGHQRYANSDLRRIVVGFDTETFEEIRARADTEHTSFAEQVRTLVTWGMEDAHAS